MDQTQPISNTQPIPLPVDNGGGGGGPRAHFDLGRVISAVVSGVLALLIGLLAWIGKDVVAEQKKMREEFVEFRLLVERGLGSIDVIDRVTRDHETRIRDLERRK